MSDRDNHATGHNGLDHPDNNPNGKPEQREDCERCICDQDGYSEQLGQFLCVDCLVLAYSKALLALIGAHTDDAGELEDIFAMATPRTDDDGNYTSVDFDVFGESHSVKISEIKPNKGEKK